MLTKDALPERALHGLWRALDVDSSGFIDVEEFGRWVASYSMYLPTSSTTSD